MRKSCGSSRILVFVYFGQQLTNAGDRQHESRHLARSFDVSYRLKHAVDDWRAPTIMVDDESLIVNLGSQLNDR
jgi:hypothetical protein